MEYYTYNVFYVPPTCTTFAVSDEMTFGFNGEPPDEIEMGGTLPCSGTRWKLNQNP